MNRDEYDRLKTGLIQSMVFDDAMALENIVISIVQEYEIDGMRRWIDGLSPKPTNTLVQDIHELKKELEEDPP